MDVRREKEGVSLEAFITANWQILTIFGVFAGITNYMNGLNNPWLLTLGFLLTFIVGLEILQLLLRIDDASWLLRAFTLLLAVFMLVFAGFILSNHISDLLSGFGLALYPIISENRVLLIRIMFFFSTMLVVLGVYRHIRSLLASVAEKLRFGDRKVLAGFFSLFIVVSGALAYLVWFDLAPEDAVSGESRDMPIESATSTTMPPSTSSTTTSSTTTTTSTTQPVIACTLNSDCGNRTRKRICYNGDVYIQETRPICQRPGTAEARCVYRTNLEGKTITQEARPEERCARGCSEGECV